MNRLFKIAVSILLLVITTSSPVIAQAPIKIEPPKVLSTKEMIIVAATQFNQDPTLISKVSWCESGHKVLPHDGGRGRNMTGIHDATFRGWLPLYQKETGETLDIGSVYDQFKMMSWAFSKGESYRRQWTTYRAIENGGTYAFYSRLLQKNFVVRCK